MLSGLQAGLESDIFCTTPLGILLFLRSGECFYGLQIGKDGDYKFVSLPRIPLRSVFILLGSSGYAVDLGVGAVAPIPKTMEIPNEPCVG